MWNRSGSTCSISIRLKQTGGLGGVHAFTGQDCGQWHGEHTGLPPTPGVNKALVWWGWGRFWTTPPPFCVRDGPHPELLKVELLSPFHIYLFWYMADCGSSFWCQVQNILVYPLWSSPCLLLTALMTPVLELCLHSPSSLVTTPCTRQVELLRGKISLSICFCAPMIICLLLMAEKFTELPLRYRLFHIKIIQVPVHL